MQLALDNLAQQVWIGILSPKDAFYCYATISSLINALNSTFIYFISLNFNGETGVDFIHGISLLIVEWGEQPHRLQFCWIAMMTDRSFGAAALYWSMYLVIDRTNGGSHSHRNYTSLHADGGPFSLPATVWSRSDCDWTEVSLLSTWDHRRQASHGLHAAKVWFALFPSGRSSRTRRLAVPCGSCT